MSKDQGKFDLCPLNVRLNVKCIAPLHLQAWAPVVMEDSRASTQVDYLMSLILFIKSFVLIPKCKLLCMYGLLESLLSVSDWQKSSFSIALSFRSRLEPWMAAFFYMLINHVLYTHTTAAQSLTAVATMFIVFTRCFLFVGSAGNEKTNNAGLFSFFPSKAVCVNPLSNLEDFLLQDSRPQPKCDTCATILRI